MHIHTRTRTHTHTHTHTVHVCTHTHTVHACTHTHTHMHTHTDMHAHTHACTHTLTEIKWKDEQVGQLLGSTMKQEHPDHALSSKHPWDSKETGRSKLQLTNYCPKKDLNPNTSSPSQVQYQNHLAKPPPQTDLLCRVPHPGRRRYALAGVRQTSQCPGSAYRLAVRTSPRHQCAHHQGSEGQRGVTPESGNCRRI